MSAILVGHSFVRRMRGAALGHPYDRKRNNVQDITTAETLAAKIIVNKTNNEIYTCANFNTFSVCGGSIRLRTIYDIVLIDFGSNDLTNLKKVAKSFCDRLEHFLIAWALACKAKKVFICPRTNGLVCNSDIF